MGTPRVEQGQVTKKCTRVADRAFPEVKGTWRQPGDFGRYFVCTVMTAMVDTELRHRLSQDVRRLVTGRMSNDDFDDAYYECYSDSDDQAIREISRFCWSLYSSDVLFPYRLRGRHAIDDATHKRAAHAVLFLQTENEYGYPETPASIADSIVGCGWFNGGLLGIAFIVIGLLALIGGDVQIAGICTVAGIAIIGLCILVAYAQRKSHDSFCIELDTIGNTAIWPFTDAASLDKANSNNYLLSNFKPEIAK